MKGCPGSAAGGCAVCSVQLWLYVRTRRLAAAALDYLLAKFSQQLQVEVVVVHMTFEGQSNLEADTLPALATTHWHCAPPRAQIGYT